MPPLAPGLKASYNKMKRGWTAGHDLRLDFRFGLGAPDRLRKCATELVALARDGSTVQPLPDSMSARFALQWRYSGCVACREGCDGGYSAIRHGRSRRDAHCRLGNGCMRPAAPIAPTRRP